jgi:hypothetical protein
MSGERQVSEPQQEALIVARRALRWLLHSGVIGRDGAATAWLAPENPAQQFVSAEITGYAASFFCWIGLRSNAMHCARWLVTNAQDTHGAFRCRWYSTDTPANGFAHTGPIRWSFDTGIVLRGLADVYRLTEASELVPSIEAAVQFLLGIRRVDGLFPGRWNVAKWKAADDDNRWSAQPGAYQAKIDLGLASTALALDRPEWLAGLEQRVDAYIGRFQTDDGRFISYPATQGLHTHPHLYACEALWALSKMFAIPRWHNAARRGVQWLTNHAIAGRFPRTFFNDKVNLYGRCDAAAQYLRSLVLFGHHRKLIKDAYKHLREYTGPTGAFVFGWNADSSRNAHPDTWGTMAAIQALCWFAGSDSPNPTILI